MEGDELAEVKRDIREVRVGLQQAQEWRLQTLHRLTSLLEEKQRLTTGMTPMRCCAMC